jgi:hypothetical protein
MKAVIEFFHKYAPLSLFFSMIIMMIYLLIARIYFGYFPYYGDRPDPSAFGYAIVHNIGIISLMLSIPINVIWLLITILALITYQRSFIYNYKSILIYILSTSVLLVMRLCFFEVFDWYTD